MMRGGAKTFLLGAPQSGQGGAGEPTSCQMSKVEPSLVHLYS